MGLICYKKKLYSVMKLISKIYVFLKVFGLLMKQSKSQKKQLKQLKRPIPLNDGIKIGSVSDKFLKADIKVKDTTVIIDISGFYDECDAMLWAKMQSELWLQELSTPQPNNNITLH